MIRRHWSFVIGRTEDFVLLFFLCAVRNRPHPNSRLPSWYTEAGRPLPKGERLCRNVCSILPFSRREKGLAYGSSSQRLVEGMRVVLK